MSSAIGSSLSPSILQPNALAGTTSPSGTTSTSGTSASPGSASSSPSPALYRDFGSATFATGPLGLRTPQNPEDAALILSQASLALDEAASGARSARIASAAAGLRTTLGGAVAALVSAEAQLAKNKADKATAETDRAAAGQERAPLAAERDALAAIPAQDRTEAENARLAEVTAALVPIDARIALLDAKIGALAAKITELENAGTQRNAALLAAFGALGVGRQDADQDQVGDADRGQALEQGFEAIVETTVRFREAALDRIEQDATIDQEERKVEDAKRVEEIATGLAAGIFDAVAVLRQPAQEPAFDARAAALAAPGRRYQLSL